MAKTARSLWPQDRASRVPPSQNRTAISYRGGLLNIGNLNLNRANERRCQNDPHFEVILGGGSIVLDPDGRRCRPCETLLGAGKKKSPAEAGPISASAPSRSRAARAALQLLDGDDD